MGGTKIEVAALDDHGRIHARRRVPTPSDYAQLLDTLARLVAETEDEVGMTACVGVGCRGAKCPRTGLMKNAENLAIDGASFDVDLSARLQRPVRVANDAHCFALSEATDGAGAGASTVFGTIVGTGVGGGIVIDGQLLRGTNGIMGEWGHNPLPSPRGDEWPGPRCYCGRRSCIESYLSGGGMSRDHREITAQTLPAATIAERARQGDPECVAPLERYAERMARALASVINLLDPEVIVLGGGVSNIAELYDWVPQRWGPYVVSSSVATRLLPNRHGDASGVRGAAWLWPAGQSVSARQQAASPSSRDERVCR